MKGKKTKEVVLKCRGQCILVALLLLFFFLCIYFQSNIIWCNKPSSTYKKPNFLSLHRLQHCGAPAARLRHTNQRRRWGRVCLLHSWLTVTIQGSFRLNSVCHCQTFPTGCVRWRPAVRGITLAAVLMRNNIRIKSKMFC